MLRSDPMGLIPPLTRMALVIVARLLTVNDPGRSASPRTYTRTERRSPIDTTACVPIICSLTRVSMRALACSKRRPSHVDGPQIGKHDASVAVHGQRMTRSRIADELHLEPVTRPDDELRRHRDVGHRREGSWRPCEEVIAKGLQRVTANRLERQQSQLDAKVLQDLFDGQALRRLQDGQARQSARHPGPADRLHLLGRACRDFRDAPSR